MSKYVTTNLRFEEGIYEELRRMAAREGRPLAAVVRDAVARYLGRSEDAPAIPFGEDPADELVGAVDSSARDESVSHDHYLYGWPKESGNEGARRHERAPGAVRPKGPEPRRRRSLRKGKPRD